MAKRNGMNILRNAFGLIVGVIVGSLLNMALVTLGPQVIPPPEGVDLTDVEALKNSAHLLVPKHFVFPFLAHALGTLVGSLIAFLIATDRKIIFGMAVGGFFLVGGIMASAMIPAPIWFVVLDLVAAYIPMAWLGTRIGGSMSERSSTLRERGSVCE
jgi:hypothetical protein